MGHSTFRLAISLSACFASVSGVAQAQVIKQMVLSAPLSIENVGGLHPLGVLAVKNDKGELLGEFKKLPDLKIIVPGLIRAPGTYTLEFHPDRIIKQIKIFMRLKWDLDDKGEGSYVDVAVTGTKSGILAETWGKVPESKSSHSLIISNKSGEPLFTLK
jgi:hypothetical protein